MASKRGLAAAVLVILAMVMLAGACSQSEDEGRWREPGISGAWSKPDNRSVVLTVDDGGECDVKSEISVTETSESVMVSVRFYELTQKVCTMMKFGYQLPFDLKAPLGNRKLLEPTGEVPETLSAQPDSTYETIPVKVIRTS